MATFPSFQFREYTISTDPSGFRNTTGGGFRGIKSTLASETLIFSPLNISPSGGITETHLLLGRVNSFGTASGVYDLRFFLTSSNAFTQGTYRFLEHKNIQFLVNRRMSEADNNTPISIPSTTNWRNTYGGGILSGIAEDDVTEYLYLGLYIREDVPFGTYGPANFTYRCLYTFS